MTGSEINGKVYCALCDGRNLGDDYSYCDTQTKLPENCLSGNIKGKGCLLCNPGYYSNTNTMDCAKNEIPGCGIYDSQQSCIECDTFNGFYSIDSIFRNGQVFQTVCNFGSGALSALVAWVVLARD